MSMLKDITRRTTTRILQNLGVAEKTVDEEFETLQGEYASLGEFIQEAKVNVKNCGHSLDAFCQSSRKWAGQIRNAEPSLVSLSGLAHSGKPTESDPSQLLHQTLTMVHTCLEQIGSEILLNSLRSLDNTTIAHIMADEEAAKDTQLLLNRRKQARLDYDTVRRSSSSERDPRSEEARLVFEEISRGVSTSVTDRSAMRYQAIISIILGFVRSFHQFFSQSLETLEPLMKLVDILATSFQASKQGSASAVSHPSSPVVSQPSSPGVTPSNSPPPTVIPQVLQMPTPPQQQPQLHQPVPVQPHQPQQMPVQPPTQFVPSQPHPTLVDLTGGNHDNAFGGARNSGNNDTAFGVRNSGSNDTAFGVRNSGGSQVQNTTSSSASLLDFTSPGVVNNKPSTTSLLFDSVLDPTPLSPASKSFSVPSIVPTSNTSSFDSLFGFKPQANMAQPTVQTPPSATTPPLHLPTVPTGPEMTKEEITLKVSQWKMQGGRESNLRALLCGLHQVLWPNSGWTPVGLSDLVDHAHVSEHYRHAITVVHPDKVRDFSVSHKLLAQMVFDALHTAYTKFKEESATGAPSVPRYGFKNPNDLNRAKSPGASGGTSSANNINMNINNSNPNDPLASLSPPSKTSPPTSPPPSTGDVD
ncbi:hypothetical protein Pelo_4065 [Pelomyxa schiedti]|nr:hypothetical protein Pelo_4065 [Pelomyxa schiedti]